jgi:hypothetical protein
MAAITKEISVPDDDWVNLAISLPALVGITVELQCRTTDGSIQLVWGGSKPSTRNAGSKLNNLEHELGSAAAIWVLGQRSTSGYLPRLLVSQPGIDDTSLPSRKPYAITPHDANALPAIPKGIYVGTGGDVTLRGVDGAADVTYKNLADGAYIAVQARYVRATGTTASNLIAEA